MISQRLVVKLASTYEPQYFKVGRGFTLPANKFLSYTSVANVPNSTYTNAGVTAVAINDGSDEGKEDISKRTCFISNPNFIKNYALTALGGKKLKDFTEQDCINAVDSFIGAKGGGFKTLTSGAGEANDSTVDWAQIYNLGNYSRPDQYIWIDKQMSKRIRELGGEYFGGYDGHISFLSRIAGDRNSIINALNGSGLDALNLAKNSVASGTGNPFFNAEQWRYRGGLINTYLGSEDPGMTRLTRTLAEFEINNKALAYLGVPNTRMMSFMFPAKREFPGERDFGFSEIYRHPVNGGTMDCYSFTLYNPEYQAAIAYLSYIFCSDIFCWEDTARRGTNPNIVIPDLVREDGFELYKYRGPNNPPRASWDYKYVTRDVGYFEMMYGPGHDAVMIGVESYTKMVQWAGQNSTWATHKLSSDSQYCSNNASYVMDRLNQNQPIARLHKDGNKRALFFYDLTAVPGTVRSYDVNVDGGVFTFQCETGMPYFWLIDLTSN